MSARRRARPAQRPHLVTGTLLGGDPNLSRLLSEQGDAVDRLRDGVRDRFLTTADLPIGATRINHGLGRRARHVAIGPTTANATWAWSWTTDGDRAVVITTIGVAQTAASVEVT